MTQHIFSEYHSVEMIEKKSRFIGIGAACPSLAAFSKHLQTLKSNYQDATHITYAYKIIDNGTLNIKAHDAGEPGGTAGRPIFNHLEGAQLINSTIFVIRYFGGIKLGAGGLVRAYGNCAKLVVHETPKVIYRLWENLTFTITYPQQNLFERLLAQCEAFTVNRDFGEFIRYEIAIPCENKITLLGELQNHRLSDSN